ncbi:MAG: glucose-1-phosphate thymidylyltransferase [Flavobacteriales bacterium]|nr:glucose-1-phosphate thymidylyltransferase [Flavobacteriales bacterium]|tara:strand:+ start:159 stop:1340 length:1182 start_codon:yes stop_codon:yes gene_type:complete
MNIILFDQHKKNLLPFTYTRPIADFRCGIITLKEKWEKRIANATISYLTDDYLSEKFVCNYANENYYVSGNILANDHLVRAIKALEEGQYLSDESNRLIALKTSKKLSLSEISTEGLEAVYFEDSYNKIENVWDIFVLNAEAIEQDFDLITKGRNSQPLDNTNTHIGDRLFIEEGAKVQAAILNSTSGPIYIGKNAEVMEGSVVRGGLALGESATLKLSSKIYGATTIGPHSKVGGEVNNSVVFGYSNKGHDGFLGNSVLGEWCNLGADTNVSNLKNNYASIKLWNYEKGGFKDSGRQFCGMMMGDHSKSGINTMFNTATVVGVSANVYGGGFPRSFIPSFAWGGAEKWMTFRFEKAMEVSEKMMERRGIALGEIDRAILKSVFEQSAIYRNF